jgi:hypothetical protein
MIPVKHIDPDDLPLYAMQLLPPEEMEEMTLHLQHSVEARKILAQIYGDLSLFSQTAETHEPPATAKQRLMKNVAREHREPPANPLDKYATPIDTFAPRAPVSSLLEDEPAPKTFVQRVAPWTGWLLAAGLAAFAFLQYQQTERLSSSLATLRTQSVKAQVAAINANLVLDALKDPTAVHATLTAADVKPVAQGRVTYVVNKGALLFAASNLDPLDASKTYELWVIPADGRAPMPAGTFKPDAKGNASLVLPPLEAGIEPKAFGVTIEDGEGSTTPTMPIIMKGLPG